MIRILRRLRGAIGNAVIWGLSWFTASLALLGTAQLVWGFSVDEPWKLVLYVAGNIGVTGFLTGVVFGGYLRLSYFERSLLNIRVYRFAMGGAVMAAICAPLVGLVARMAAGMPIVVADLLAGVPLAAAMGALTAGATIRLAQGASRQMITGEAARLETEQREVVALLDGKAV